jgi:hypothetical protein
MKRDAGITHTLETTEATPKSTMPHITRAQEAEIMTAYAFGRFRGATPIIGEKYLSRSHREARLSPWFAAASSACSRWRVIAPSSTARAPSDSRAPRAHNRRCQRRPQWQPELHIGGLA